MENFLLAFNQTRLGVLDALAGAATTTTTLAPTVIMATAAAVTASPTPMSAGEIGKYNILIFCFALLVLVLVVNSYFKIQILITFF